MIVATLEKIDKLIKQKQYQLPEIMLKLFAFLAHFAHRIELKNSEYAALDQYAAAFKLFKNFLIEEPFKLKKASSQQIDEHSSTNSVSQILALRDRFIKELSAFTPNDPFGKKVVSEIVDMKWLKKIQTHLPVAESVKMQIQQKKGKKLNMSQLSVLFWYGQLKGQYLVHVQTFADVLLQFIQEYFYPLSFVDNNALPYLKELADPDQKYFLTAIMAEDLFLRLRYPEVIEKLWQQSQEKVHSQPFVSQSSMMLRVQTLDHQIDHIIGVTGQKLIMPGGEERDVKLVPSIMVGSAADCDIVLNNKYISRKQMAIIEEEKREKLKQSDINRYNFSVVCLSQTNSTNISYPHQYKAQVGLIFFAEDVKYQIVKCQKGQLPLSAEDDDDHTLSILPSEKITSSSMISFQNLTLLILSGEDKEKEVVLESIKFSNSNQAGCKHLHSLHRIFSFEDEFYLKPGTRILCKTANQILEGRTSRKIRLRKDLKIYLENYILTVE